MEAYGAGAERALSVTGETAAVATQLAGILDMIQDHRETGKTMSARRVAAISVMIDDVAGEGTPGTRWRKRRRMRSACWYQEVCRLGEGGFGTVVRASHSSTGQDVAVKTPRPGLGLDASDVLREVCFMAACRGHPSLVGFCGVARDPASKEHSIIMDYVTGPGLDDVRYDRGRPFPEAGVRRIMRQLLCGAKAMHENGIVHRDIKPANILVAANGGAVKIGDFGCAKSTAEKHPRFCVAGTNGYMAPEVLLENADHDTSVDMWSLGCVMAELLTDTLMFEGEDSAGQLYRIFDVLGVPGDKALRARVFTDEVRQWRARQQRVGHRCLLRKLVPEEVLSPDGFEVLKGLLACDPRKRLTAAAALRCLWFADHDVDDALGHSIVVSKTGDAVMKSWSPLWQMAVSFAGHALGFLRATAS